MPKVPCAKVNEMIVTWEEVLADRQVKGYIEGEVTAKVDDLLVVTRHRFGDFPIGFEDEIRAISDLGRLNGLFEQILGVNSLAELGLKPGSGQR